MVVEIATCCCVGQAAAECIEGCPGLTCLLIRAPACSTFPLGLPPIRQALAALFFRSQHPTAWPLRRHATVSLVLVSTTFVVSIYLPELDFVFGLVGATAGELTRLQNAILTDGCYVSSSHCLPCPLSKA